MTTKAALKTLRNANLDQGALKVLAHYAPTEAQPEMEANIGRKCRYKNWTPDMGTAARDHEFQVIALQKNYRKEVCYRVLCLGYADRFGSIAKPTEIEFID